MCDDWAHQPDLLSCYSILLVCFLLYFCLTAEVPRPSWLCGLDSDLIHITGLPGVLAPFAPWQLE